MLIKVKKLNYTGAAYAPSIEEAIINTDHIVYITPVDSRRNEPCVEIRFGYGVQQIHCVGTPEDFLVNKGE